MASNIKLGIITSIIKAQIVYRCTPLRLRSSYAVWMWSPELLGRLGSTPRLGNHIFILFYFFSVPFPSMVLTPFDTGCHCKQLDKVPAKPGYFNIIYYMSSATSFITLTLFSISHGIVTKTRPSLRVLPTSQDQPSDGHGLPTFLTASSKQWPQRHVLHNKPLYTISESRDHVRIPSVMKFRFSVGLIHCHRLRAHIRTCDAVHVSQANISIYRQRTR